jgi:hypothetical protein
LDLYEEPKPVEKVRLQVPPEVAGIVRKPMAKRPEERYQTPGELAAVLAVLSPQKVHKEELTPTVTFVQPESVAGAEALRNPGVVKLELRKASAPATPPAASAPATPAGETVANWPSIVNPPAKKPALIKKVQLPWARPTRRCPRRREPPG